MERDSKLLTHLRADALANRIDIEQIHILRLALR